MKGLLHGCLEQPLYDVFAALILREDIALDEIHGSFLAIEYMIADGDGLQRH